MNSHRSSQLLPLVLSGGLLLAQEGAPSDGATAPPSADERVRAWCAERLPGPTPSPPSCGPAAPPALGIFKAGASVVSGGSGGAGSDVEPSAAWMPSRGLMVAYTAATTAEGSNGLGMVHSPSGGVMVGTSFATGRQHHGDPQLAVGGDGRLYLSWLAWDGGSCGEGFQMIGLTSTSTGTSWASPTDVVDMRDCPQGTRACLGATRLGVGPSRSDPKVDRVYVAYEAAGAGGWALVRSDDQGANFSSSLRLGPGVDLDLFVDSRGGVHLAQVRAGAAGRGGEAAWGDPGHGVFYAASTNEGQGISSWQRVSGEGQRIPLHLSSPEVVADAVRGWLYVVYPAATAERGYELWLASSRDGGTSWKRRKLGAERPCATRLAPSTTFDPRTGRIYVMWREGQGTTGWMAMAWCGPGGEKCSPTQRVSRTFPASLALEGQGGAGDSDALVIDPRNRKLHAVFSHPIQEGAATLPRIGYVWGALPP